MRVSEIVGKSVISRGNGDELGHVTDLLVDAEASRVVALVIGHGPCSAEHVLRYADVRRFGSEAVLTQSAARLIRPREWAAREADTPRSSTLKNRRVMTDHGRYLGAVRDMLLHDQTGRIEAYDIAGVAFAGRIQRSDVRPHPEGNVAGPAAIVVSEEAVAAVTADEEPDSGSTGRQ
jgi:uncharacterized protein YrrD